MQLSRFAQHYLIGAPCGLFAALRGNMWMVVLERVALLPTARAQVWCWTVLKAWRGSL